MKIKDIWDLSNRMVMALRGGLIAQDEIKSLRQGKMDTKIIEKGRDAGWIRVKMEFFVKLPDEDTATEAAPVAPPTKEKKELVL